MDLNSTLASWQVIAAIIIFLTAFALILTGMIHRAYVVWGGVLLMIICGIEKLSSVFMHHLAWQTALLLISMMVMAGITSQAGLFQYTAVKLAQKGMGNPFRLLLVLALLAALGAALLDHVSIILLLVPFTLTLAKRLGVTPIPFIMTEMLSANIGGTATLMGTTSNLILGTSSAVPLTFNDFWLSLGPIILIILIVTLLVLRFWFAKEWEAMSINLEALKDTDASSYISNKRIGYQVAGVWVLVLAGFILQNVFNIIPAFVALAGAMLLLILCLKKDNWKEAAHYVEWGTLVFIVGFVILVGGLTESGIIHAVALKGMELTSANPVFVSILLLWISGIASATLDSVPFTAAFIPLVHDLTSQMNLEASSSFHLRSLWLAIALGTGLGSNATLFGSSANIIAAGLAMREGKKLSFIQFMKLGIPISLLSLLLATAYLLLVLV